MSEMVIRYPHLALVCQRKLRSNSYTTQWLAQIRQADIVAVSTISCYEVAPAYNKGRLAIHIPVQD